MRKNEFLEPTCMGCDGTLFTCPDTGTYVIDVVKEKGEFCDGTLFTCPDTGTYVIDVVKEKGEFLVYPNPATNSVKCIVNSEELNKNTSVFIYDVYGREIIHKILDLRQKTLKIDVSSLESGVYFIKVGEITRKFIKQ